MNIFSKITFYEEDRRVYFMYLHALIIYSILHARYANVTQDALKVFYKVFRFFIPNYPEGTSKRE